MKKNKPINFQRIIFAKSLTKYLVFANLGIFFLVLMTTVYSFENQGDSDLTQTGKAETYQNTRRPMPFDSLTPVLSSEVPYKVNPHSQLLLTDIEDRPFFDFFSWQMFVALVWPADANTRGVPNSKVTADNFHKYNTGDPATHSPVVWQSFRGAGPLFAGGKGYTPPKWDAPPKPFLSPEMFTRVTKKGQATVEDKEAFSHPLIDQNHQYVLYNVRFNEVLYKHIWTNEWYDKGNIPKNPTQASIPPLPLISDPLPDEKYLAKGQYLGNPAKGIYQPQTNTLVTGMDPKTIKSNPKENSISIKTAWRIMITDSTETWHRKDKLERYYVIDAKTTDIATGKIIDVKLGLVGIHLVQKTVQFTEGIWASFEHVDNLEAPNGIRPSFFCGNLDSLDKRGYNYIPSDTLVKEEAKRRPVQVSRVYKIPDTPKGPNNTYPYEYSTQGLNKVFQELLQGTVWENYQLVITQWPTDPTSFYARNYFYPRGIDKDGLESQPPAIQQAWHRADKQAQEAYPRWSGLPIPQVGALNTTMETYFQSPETVYKPGISKIAPLENSSCMGCHYGASDVDYNWTLRNHTYPQKYEQGRIWNEGASEVSNFKYSATKK